jgi:DNA-binding CsgD family transcriptional regulator/tetratricopeptide (TPR) repeat protein
MLERGPLLEGLGALLEEAAQGRGHLVVVKGEAGIGKTTVVRAFVSTHRGPVRWGNCDPVFPPRPFAPVVDIAADMGGQLEAALAEGDPHRVSAAFLSALRAETEPSVVVLEDLQWADEASLELLQVVGRRLDRLAALVIATLRPDDVDLESPLPAALGDIPADTVVTMDIPPLSMEAVTELASTSGVDPAVLHRITGGNPFFVNEVVASGATEVPSTVRDAVLASTKRLSPSALHWLRAASVMGPRSALAVLSAVADTPPSALDECVDRGILCRRGSTIEFRHEILQRAILEALSGADRRRLHSRALVVLRDTRKPVDVAELARHAVAADDAEAILEFAPQAGAKASGLGAHRTARAHYEDAFPLAHLLDGPERASLLAAYAHECYVTDDPASAVTYQQDAVAWWRDAGDDHMLGRALSDLAEYLMWTGQGVRGREVSMGAISLLEALPADADLARAYARRAQLLLVAGHDTEAIDWGTKAVDLGERLGAEAVVVHALNTVGSAEMSLGSDHGLAKLEESLKRADAAELHEDVGRALGNLMSSAFENKRHDLADRYMAQAAAFAAMREFDFAVRCIDGDLVKVLLEEGRWDEAAQHAREVVDHGWQRGRNESLVVLGRLAARRGEGNAFAWLDEALEMLDPEMWGKGTCEVRTARAEAAWLTGDLRRAATEVEAGLAVVHEATNPWLVGELDFWARRIGVDWVPPSSALPEPYAFFLAGHPDKAATAWAALGCPYEEALALAESDDQESLRRALDICQGLGAVPLANRVSERLRSMGAQRIARGPRASTRANPAGLSNREVEVLVLLAQGLRNVDIAERLVVSTRTVDHHVSTLLMKLGAENRSDASQKAREFGLAK